MHKSSANNFNCSWEGSIPEQKEHPVSQCLVGYSFRCLKLQACEWKCWPWISLCCFWGIAITSGDQICALKDVVSLSYLNIYFKQEFCIWSAFHHRCITQPLKVMNAVNINIKTWYKLRSGIHATLYEPSFILYISNENYHT